MTTMQLVQLVLTGLYLLLIVSIAGFLGYMAIRQGRRMDRIVASQTEMVERAQANNTVSAHAAEQLAAILQERDRDRERERDAPHDAAH